MSTPNPKMQQIIDVAITLNAYMDEINNDLKAFEDTLREACVSVSASVRLVERRDLAFGWRRLKTKASGSSWQLCFFYWGQKTLGCHSIFEAPLEVRYEAHGLMDDLLDALTEKAEKYLEDVRLANQKVQKDF